MNHHFNVDIRFLRKKRDGISNTAWQTIQGASRSRFEYSRWFFVKRWVYQELRRKLGNRASAACILWEEHEIGIEMKYFNQSLRIMVL